MKIEKPNFMWMPCNFNYFCIYW